MAKRVKYHDSHDFFNDSNETLTIFVEPGEIVRLTEHGSRIASADYSGEEFGNEVEVPPNSAAQTVQFAL